MWSRISTAVPGGPVRVETAAAVGQHDGARRPLRPPSGRRAPPVRPAALVEVGTPGEDRRDLARRGPDRPAARRRDRPRSARRSRAARPARSCRSAHPDRRRRPTSRSPARRPIECAIRSVEDRAQRPWQGVRIGRRAIVRHRIGDRTAPTSPVPHLMSHRSARSRSAARAHQPLAQGRERSSAT